MKIDKDDLQELLKQSLARHNVAGASIAVLNGDELTTAAAGVTNVNTSVELTADTVMHIGSITKIFTTTLVMQLVDEGKVDLDERVVHYLPDLRLKDREALEQITVKMLLNHTSGIDGATLPDHGHDEETIEKGVARFAELGQLFQPGMEFSYCNPGMVIAGYLTQQLQGESWYKLVRNRIFAPLGMEHATTLPEEALLYRAGVGHFLSPVSSQKLVRTSVVFLPQSFGPAGRSLMMSAQDLVTFARVHMRHGTGSNGARILSERSATAMQETTVNNKGKGYTHIDMGLGWMISHDGLLTHGGGGPGIISTLYVHPEAQFAAAILTNSAHGTKVINEFIAPWLKEVGLTKPLGPVSTPAPAEPVKIDPDKYTGVYEDRTERYVVSQAADRLTLSVQAKFAFYDYMSTDATPPARLAPLSSEQFLVKTDGKTHNDSSGASRIVNFRNPDAAGRMQHIGDSNRLRKRIS